MKSEPKTKKKARRSPVPKGQVTLTPQQKYIARLEAEAKKAGGSLGHLASAAKMRPDDFFSLNPETQWAIDKSLGILDWNGDWKS